MFGFTPKSFSFYVCDIVAKRKTIGSKPGRKSIINTYHTEFTVQHTARADHAKEGLCTKEVVQNVISLRDGTED
jgi:hypothetical protein